MLKVNVMLIFLFLMAGCSQPGEKSEENIAEQPALDIVDIRIYEDGQVFLNGNSTNYSALPSLVESLDISEQTLARFIFVMGEQTPLVYETTRLLQQHGTFNIHKIILPHEEFYSYLEQNIHIDILNTGRILLDGNELYAEDLAFALNTPDITPDRNFILTLPEGHSESTHDRVVQILDSLGFNQVEYEDLAEF